ncbi:MAG: pseudouridine synthase [Flammeovirgaceae bacterium]|jgi:23S rRNA pseudouridine2605 synthase|nr:pseudouridine synthase [Flammeovirgaceae bacterium]|tara:strand:+ start:2997 stop:3716 length:720 start_codon:yes stop_codon:yes gene_type:complete
MKKKSESSEIRINKFISQSGICSRREADNLIKKGLVSINGKKCITLGQKIKLSDKVFIEKKEVKREKKIYILLNKPKDFITTNKDTHGRRTVFELLKGVNERVFHVGRLDRKTTGLILFTNDGDLTKKLTHPSHKVKKVYYVKLDRALEESDLKKIKLGIKIDEESVNVNNISRLDKKDEVGVEIHIGKNRIIRKIFESLNYKVDKLDRVLFGTLTKKNLPRGKWRKLTENEIRTLKSF